MGNAQEGDQLGTGQSLLKIFDPGEMEVSTMVGEPDGAILGEGTTATVYLDAYPDAIFRARFHSASPVRPKALPSRLPMRSIANPTINAFEHSLIDALRGFGVGIRPRLHE